MWCTRHDKAAKTTTLLGLAQQLTAEGHYLALCVSCETASPFGNDLASVEEALLSEIRQAAALQRWDPELLPPSIWPDTAPGTRLKAGLTAWVQQCPRPLVLLFDEIDSLRGDGLLSVLRQLRAGFTQNRDEFVHSVLLCGLRDVRASQFNIKVTSVRMGDFSRTEIGQLYSQHTRDLGLIAQGKQLHIANPIYQEVIARSLASKHSAGELADQLPPVGGWASSPDETARGR